MVKLELVLEPDEAYLILCAVERAREVSACDSEERERPPQPMAGTERAAETAGGSAETSRPSRADGAVKLAESFLAGQSGKRKGRRAFPGHGSFGSGGSRPGWRMGGHPGGRHPRFRGNVSKSGSEPSREATNGVDILAALGPEFLRQVGGSLTYTNSRFSSSAMMDGMLPRNGSWRSPCHLRRRW